MMKKGMKDPLNFQLWLILSEKGYRDICLRENIGSWHLTLGGREERNDLIHLGEGLQRSLKIEPRIVYRRKDTLNRLKNLPTKGWGQLKFMDNGDE